MSETEIFFQTDFWYLHLSKQKTLKFMNGKIDFSKMFLQTVFHCSLFVLISHVYGVQSVRVSRSIILSLLIVESLGFVQWKAHQHCWLGKFGWPLLDLSLPERFLLWIHPWGFLILQCTVHTVAIWLEGDEENDENLANSKHHLRLWGEHWYLVQIGRSISFDHIQQYGNYQRHCWLCSFQWERHF